ncbi:DNA primase [Synechococcus sp. R60.3]|uniref:DNA primase n=1 Tax=unclassified Synechococcus TaxID=2626047 RepID=UPI0039C2422C
MSGLPPDFIQLVRQKADLVEVVAEKVVLRKQGKNFVGLCPFHNDHKPSFQVSPSKQIYKCFSCGAGGDVLRFVMQTEHLPFAEAVRHLARRYHIPLPTRNPEAQPLGSLDERELSHREKLLEILAMAADFYQHALRSQLGSAARQYLHSRHLSEETLQKFQIGFAPPGWQSLYEYLVNHKRQPVKLLEEAGLLVPRQQGSGHYDRFRNRIMLPIFDVQGRVIGFAGRALGESGQPKYLNSPETELFNKSQVVYGLNFARDAIAKADQVLVVEGYFDVIALHQAGVAYAVAAMGTALTPHQVKILLRYTQSKRLILNFDADRAGLNAANRAIEAVEEQARRGEIELRILTLPEGKDADEFLREYKSSAPPTRAVAELQTLIEQAPLWLDWRIEQVLAGRDLSRAADFQQARQALVQLLAGLGGQWRSLYLHKVAELLSRGNGRLSRDLEEDLRRAVRQYRWAKPQQPSLNKGSKLLQSESHLLQIFLHFGEYRHEIRQTLLERELQFSFRPHRELWQRILELISAQPELEDRGETLLTALRTLCAQDEQLNERLSHLLWLDENTRVALMRPRMVVRAAIANMELEIRQKRYRYWTQLWDQAFSEGNTALAAQYQASIQQEYQAIQALQRQVQLSLEDMSETPLAEDL